MNKKILDFLNFHQPTIEQEKVLSELEVFVKSENLYDFIVLTGAAGTGKTSIVSALVGYLNHIGKKYIISAPTGRAARIISRKSSSVATTIHSLIYNTEETQDHKMIFKLKSGYNHFPAIYIIDEASMIAQKADKNDGLFLVERGLIYDLITYIKEANVNNKIIFIGDRYQLPPIGETESVALNRQFLETNFNLKGKEFHLTEVKRQADGSYILQNATDIRKAMDEKQTKHEILGKKSKNIYEASKNYVDEFKQKGNEFAIAIGVSNKANSFFNDLVREKIFGKARKMLEPGDLLMVVKNWTRNQVNLYNGDHVELMDVDWNIQEVVAGLHFVPIKIKLLFTENNLEVEDYVMLEPIITPGGRIAPELEITLRAERFRKNKVYANSKNPSDDKYVGALHLVYGHAITCNKAQGGEWEKVFINTLGVPNLKWQYTAVTRAKKGIESFGNQ